MRFAMVAQPQHTWGEGAGGAANSQLPPKGDLFSILLKQQISHPNCQCRERRKSGRVGGRREWLVSKQLQAAWTSDAVHIAGSAVVLMLWGNLAALLPLWAVETKPVWKLHMKKKRKEKKRAQIHYDRPKDNNLL